MHVNKSYLGTPDSPSYEMGDPGMKWAAHIATNPGRKDESGHPHCH